MQPPPVTIPGPICRPDRVASHPPCNRHYEFNVVPLIVTQIVNYLEGCVWWRSSALWAGLTCNHEPGDGCDTVLLGRKGAEGAVDWLVDQCDNVLWRYGYEPAVDIEFVPKRSHKPNQEPKRMERTLEEIQLGKRGTCHRNVLTIKIDFIRMSSQ